MYKWGYFPEFEHFENSAELSDKSSHCNRILWVGRFLDWKHPDHALDVASFLKDKGYSFVLDCVGVGPLGEKMKQTIVERNLETNVNLLGSMSPKKVRALMKKANVFLFTSDRQEGWGAVLNEAMNSGCSVVASHLAGATPYLIENERNGLIYESGNVSALCEKVEYLLCSPGAQARLGRAAYRTIAEVWNASVAANRLFQLSESILKGNKNPDLFEDGPCSRAKLIREDWYKE